MDLDEAAIVFAGLDMRQRLCEAIALADHRKIDSGLRSRLRNMRSKIDRDKIVDRRNRAVHGVHRASEKPQHMVLSMPRLSGNARDAELSVKDFYDLSFEIRDLGIEAWSIFNDYGTWMFGEHRSEHDPRQLETARSGVWLKIKQYLGTRTSICGVKRTCSAGPACSTC